MSLSSRSCYYLDSPSDSDSDSGSCKSHSSFDKSQNNEPKEESKAEECVESEFKFIPMPGSTGENVPFVQILRRPTLMKN
jgi:hypothetical protein